MGGIKETEMKIRPKKAALIGLASSVLFCAAGCEEKKKETTETPQTISTTENDVPTVYGPPADLTENITVDDNELPDVYGPPTDLTEAPSVEDNDLPTVYGPPTNLTENITVDDNELPDVYGPPEDF